MNCRVACKLMAGCLSLFLRRGTSIILLRSNRSKLVSLYSTMSRLLIEEPKYSWLQQLGLKSDNPGVFCGTWSGNGQVGVGTSSTAVYKYFDLVVCGTLLVLCLIRICH